MPNPKTPITRHPDDLNDEEKLAILQWFLGADGVRKLASAHPLENVVSQRNAFRAAGAFGEGLVAMMFAAGVLNEDESPFAAMERLIRGQRRAKPRALRRMEESKETE
jgi:hypothetical protein